MNTKIDKTIHKILAIKQAFDSNVLDITEMGGKISDCLEENKMVMLGDKCLNKIDINSSKQLVVYYDLVEDTEL